MTNEQLTKMVDALTKRVNELEKMNGVIAETIAEKKDDKKEKKVDPNKPKKTTGYIIYSNTVRDDVKEKLIAGGGDGKPKEVVQAIAAKWKLLTYEEKNWWNVKAKELSDEDSSES